MMTSQRLFWVLLAVGSSLCCIGVLEANNLLSNKMKAESKSWINITMKNNQKMKFKPWNF